MKYVHLTSYIKITLVCKHIICAITYVWGENNNHIKTQLISFPSVSGFRKLQSMLWKMCISHPSFPLINYLPFAPTRGLLSFKSIYTGGNLFIDYKIGIIKSVKWSGISLTAEFKMAEVFIRRKYLKLILQVFMFPSQSWRIDTNHSRRQHRTRDEQPLQYFFQGYANIFSPLAFFILCETAGIIMRYEANRPKLLWG